MGVDVALMKDLRGGMSLEEALLKHNTNLKLALGIQKRKLNPPAKRNIYPKSNGYAVMKVICNHSVYFGVYNKLSEAQKVRDELVKCDWDKSKLKEIIQRLNITVPEEAVKGNKYVYKSNNGKWYVEKKFKTNGKYSRVYGGQYETLSEARTIRTELVRNNWNIELLPEIKRKHNIVDTQGR